MPEADPYMTLSTDSNIKVKGEGRERKQTLWVLAQDDRPFVPSLIIFCNSSTMQAGESSLNDEGMTTLALKMLSVDY